MTAPKISAAALALAAVAVLCSIAASDILLGVALLAFLVARPKFEMPRFAWPLLAYLGWTVLSALLSPPLARHMSQIKKFFVFTILLVGWAVLREFKQQDWVARGMVAAATLSSATAIVQFIHGWRHWQSLHLDFYENYQLHRITGFMSHWMNYSGQMMLVSALLVAWLVARHVSAPPLWQRIVGWSAAAIIATGVVLSFTRGVWVGCAAGAVYLLWHDRRRWLFALPVLALVVYFAAPETLKVRVRSFQLIFSSSTDNSVEARKIMYRAGWKMIQAHPVIGVGPEGVKDEFDNYRPDTYKPPAWYGHLHSNYLQTAASRGIPALLFLLAFFAIVLWDQHTLATRLAGDPQQWLVRGVTAATIAYYAEGAVEYNFGGSEVLMVWLFLLVLGYSLRDKVC